ncbi:putative conserved hypothetical protein, partial [Colletotrichum sublineola]
PHAGTNLHAAAHLERGAGLSAASHRTKVDESGCMTYAELIRAALLSSETQKMELGELYDWFRRNTRRANSGNEGWKNSVRSNLSLNEVCPRLQAGVLQLHPADSRETGLSTTGRERLVLASRGERLETNAQTPSESQKKGSGAY